MAYTAFGQDRIVRPWQFGHARYVHRSVTLPAVDGSGDASGTIKIPGPGRIVGVQYGIKTGADIYGGATSGTLTLVDSFDAVTKFTDATITAAQDGYKPVGTTSLDEARGVTAATDGFSGGIPVRGDIDVVIASGTETEVITVDVLVRLCTYARVSLRPSGSAGSASDSRILRLSGAGVLAAVGIDFGSGVPATADVTITADDATNGTALFTSTNSSTDLAPTLIGRPGLDEAAGASAATDGTEACNGYKQRLIVAVAQADPYVNSTDEINVELWIDD
jgi:hypothetical protein